MKRRLYYALACFAVLIAVAALVLHDIALYAVEILLVGLALKTVIAYKAGWGSE